MTIKEFAKLTGYTPTFEEYAQIEQAYHEFDGDNKALEKFPLGTVHDIRQGLNYILMGLYENGYKGTTHYRMLRNVLLNI